MDAFSYYVFVGIWSLFISWWIVFNIMPNLSFGKKKEQHDDHHVMPKASETPRPRHSTHDGFKAYATNGELTVDDIVKALSRGND